MILVDTSIIIPWLDPSHAEHGRCDAVLDKRLDIEFLAISSVTYGELAAGGRTQEAVEEDLHRFRRIDVSFAAMWRAGVAFRRYRGGDATKPVLPDFIIRAQASVLGHRHLTNDRRRLSAIPEVEFLFPD